MIIIILTKTKTIITFEREHFFKVLKCFKKLIYRLSTFCYNIINRENSPLKLKKLILDKQVNNFYNVRSNSSILGTTWTNNHYGELTFNFFFHVPKFF